LSVVKIIELMMVTILLKVTLLVEDVVILLVGISQRLSRVETIVLLIIVHLLVEVVETEHIAGQQLLVVEETPQEQQEVFIP